MTKATRIYLYIAKQPMLCVEWLISLTLIIACIWLLTPWYHVSDQPGFMSHTTIVIVGLAFFVASTIWAVALGWRKWRYSTKVRRFFTFTMSMYFMFSGLARAFTPGPGRNTWPATVIFALILGVAYLRLRWEQDG